MNRQLRYNLDAMTRKATIICWIAALLCVFVGFSQGQGQGQALRGQVLFPGGQPVNREIRVILESIENNRVHDITYTDSNGRLVIQTVPEGNYRLRIDSDGPEFSTTIQNVYVTPSSRYVVIPLKAPPRGEAPSDEVVDARIPEKARQAYQKAVEHLKKDAHSKAEKELQKALQHHPDYFEARNDLGMLYLQGNKLTQAEAELRKAVELDPQDFRPRYNLGVALLKQEQFEESAAQLRQVLEEQPDLADAHFYLGVADYGLRLFEDSQKHLLRAYELDPEKEVEALMFLGNVYYLQGLLDKAIESFEQYLQAVPDAPNSDQVRQAIANLKAEKEKGKP